MKDIEQRKTELREMANKPHRTYTDFESGIDAGAQKAALQALEIIDELEAEKKAWQEELKFGSHEACWMEKIKLRGEVNQLKEKVEALEAELDKKTQ